jgi:tetratricopeptide (TPR) repeat protein
MRFGDYAAKASSLIDEAPRGAEYPRSVADLAITEAVAQCQAAAGLMAYLGQCGPERIPMILVEGAIDDEAERMKALAALAEASLLKHDPFEDGAPAVTVHRLVQAVARARSEANGSAQDAIGRLIARLGKTYPTTGYNDPQSWRLCGQLTPQVLALREARAEAVSDFAEWLQLLDRAGGYFHGRATYSEAAPLVRDALAIRERELGPEHPDTATTLGHLALLLHDQGDLAEARPLYERALEALRQDHPDTATTAIHISLIMTPSHPMLSA